MSVVTGYHSEMQVRTWSRMPASVALQEAIQSKELWASLYWLLDFQEIEMFLPSGDVAMSGAQGAVP